MELTRFKVQKRELRNYFVDFNALLLIFLRHLSFVTFVVKFFNRKSHKSFFFLKFELTRFKVQKRELRNYFVDFNALLLIFLRHLSFVTFVVNFLWLKIKISRRRTFRF